MYARRLKSFYDSTAPLLEYYKTRSPNKLVSLAGSTSDEIWPQLDGVVQSRFRLKLKGSPSSTRRTVPDAIIKQTEREVMTTPDDTSKP